MRLLPIALVVAATAAFAPAASSAPSLSPTGEATFPDRSFVLTLPGGTEARAGQISVTENGAPVSGLKVAPVDAAQRKRLGIVLVLDTSRSMRGEPVAQAFAAARAFAAERNESQPIGLVTFNSESTVSMPLTTEPFAIQEGLARPPETRPETHLYDASLKAVDVIRDANLPGGFVVLLSDGADFGSEASLASVSQAARDAHARIYTVGLRSPKFDPDALTALAESGGRSYTEAGSPQELSRIYSTLSAELSNAYLLRYHSVAEPRTDVAVSVDVRDVGSANAAYTSPRLAAGPAGDSDGSTWSSPLPVALAVIFFAAIVGLAVMLVLRRRHQTPRERVNSSYRRKRSSLGPSGASRTVWRPRRSVRFQGPLGGVALAKGLIAALPWSAARLLTNSLAMAAAVGLLLAAATGQALVILLCPALVPLILSAFVNSRVRRQRHLFADQLADHLAVVGSSLRAGHSFPAALAAALDDAAEPSRRESDSHSRMSALGYPSTRHSKR